MNPEPLKLQPSSTYKFEDFKRSPDLLKQFRWKSLDIHLECSLCRKVYLATRHSIYNKLKNDYKFSFCSPRCKHLQAKKVTEVSCLNCNLVFSKQSHRISANNFCTQSCSATYHNTHKTTGTRVSKLEQFISSRLSVSFPSLELHFNRKDTIGSELDIYLPYLKLGIEFNGIFHYQPIYGDKKFNQIKSNDQKKFEACMSKKIDLKIIDVSKISRFTEASSLLVFEEVLAIITNKINGGTCRPRTDTPFGNSS